MLVVDLIIAAIVVLAGVWGYRSGLQAGALALIAFGGGAVLGSQVAPLILDGGVRSSYAPLLALPGALLFGGLLARAVAALVSRSDKLRRRRRVRRADRLDDLGGPLLGACIALVGVWLLGAALVRMETLRDPLRDSTILRRLNAALAPPGPLLRAQAQRGEATFPRLDGPLPRVAPANQAITSDPEVRAARRSVVKLVSVACRRGATGSGWIAPGGIVVTNAHVVAGQRTVAFVGGRRPPLPATPIWFDRRHDIALLRVPALVGSPALRIARRPNPGTPAAILGFPGGGPYDVQAARLGPTHWFSRGGRVISRVAGRQVRVRTTALLGLTRPGNSGGPVVDEHGRVLTMIFGRSSPGLGSYGVPAATIRAALRRSGAAGARRSVGTGDCR